MAETKFANSEWEEKPYFCSFGTRLRGKNNFNILELST